MFGKGACMAGACMAGETATAVNSTHPGMHSREIMFLKMVDSQKSDHC